VIFTIARKYWNLQNDLKIVARVSMIDQPKSDHANNGDRQYEKYLVGQQTLQAASSAPHTRYTD